MFRTWLSMKDVGHRCVVIRLLFAGPTEDDAEWLLASSCCKCNAACTSRTRSELWIDLRWASNVHSLYRDGARGIPRRYLRRRWRVGRFAHDPESRVIDHLYQVMNAANIMRRTRATILTTDSGAL